MLIAHSASKRQRLDDREINERLAEFLLQENVLENTVLDRALRAARRTEERLDKVLAKLGLMSEVELGASLSRFLGIALIEPDDLPAVPILTDIIAADFVHRHHLMPLGQNGGQLVVGVTDPFHNEPVRAIAYLIKKPVEIRLFLPALFDKAFQLLYQAFPAPADDHGSAFDANDIDIERLRDLASEAPTIRLVNDMIGQAVETRASDIHLEPQVDGLSVRYRVDGRLITSRRLAAALKAPVISRVKIMAGLDIAERRLPQDGRIKIAVRGTDIDFRVSTTPIAFGESVVLRILDRSRVELDFVKLGFSRGLIQSLDKLLHEPNGIILVTGPTGSGKTTTLYTVFKSLNSSDRKLFTVEDPIEYQLTGISQIQVHPEIGLSFPHALRSILRQDPDIIMIGEIRDVETARIAIQASLTGHLVFSTVHTNSASATIIRLLDMGIENYLLASTVKAVLAQRLVRRLCPLCSVAHPDADIWAHEMKPNIRSDEPPNVRQAVGCEACNKTGFSGRTTIAELLELNAEIQSMVLAGASNAEIDSAAQKTGMATMYENGLGKVWRGETTIEEVLHVTRVV